FAGYEFGRLAGLRFVGIAFGDRSLGHAMCRQDDRKFGSRFERGPGASGLEFLDEGFDQQRMVVPGLDEVEREWWTFGSGDRVVVEPDAGTGVLWSEADRDHARHSVGCDFLHHIGDERFPVAHANVDGEMEFAGEKLSLADGDLVHRGVAD